MSLQQLLIEYGQLRAENELRLQAHIRRVRALDAGFADIANRRAASMRGIAASVRKGVSSAAAAAQAREALEELLKEEQQLLQKHDLPADYLTLQTRCSLCGDTGYVGEPARRLCSCVQAALMDEERASSQINPEEIFENAREDIFPTDKQCSQFRNALRAAEAYTNALPDVRRHNFVLLGEAGLGKTFLLNCIAARAMQRGMRVKKVTAYTMMDDILAGIRAGSDHATPYLSVALLLIDDIGTEPLLNNITREYLFTILNERRNGALATAVASNLTIENLQERYGERVFSRLISADDGSLLLLSGQNLRLLQGRS